MARWRCAAGDRNSCRPTSAPPGAASIDTGRIVPVYPLVGGLTQRRVRELLARVLGRTLRAVQDPLHEDEREGLPGLAAALKAAHFPDDPGEVRPALDRARAR